MNNIGIRLREERNKLGLSQEKLAEIGGVQKLAQTNYETGKRVPTGEYLAKIAEIGADVNYILTGVRVIKDAYRQEWDDLTAERKGLIEKLKSQTGEGTMLKGGVAGNESFSDEDVKLLKLIKALAPEQKNDTVKDLEKFVRWNKSAISHFLATNGGDLRMAA